jgi:hypothetical protein
MEPAQSWPPIGWCLGPTFGKEDLFADRRAVAQAFDGREPEIDDDMVIHPHRNTEPAQITSQDRAGRRVWRPASITTGPDNVPRERYTDPKVYECYEIPYGWGETGRAGT